jgi:hypothetical protein
MTHILTSKELDQLRELVRLIQRAYETGGITPAIEGRLVEMAHEIGPWLR